MPTDRAARSLTRSAAVLAAVATTLLAACGASGQAVSVGGSTTSRPTVPDPASKATTPKAAASKGAASKGAASKGAASKGAASKGAASKGAASTAPAVAACTGGGLRADQVPLSGGTGEFALAWSLTNTTATTCDLVGGRPALAFVDGAGTTISRYTVSAVGAPGAATLALAPGRSAWFVTDESAAGCGVGTTVADGPFHYVLTLPGGATLDWTAAYLAAPTLTDFCADVALGVGALRSSRPVTG